MAKKRHKNANKNSKSLGCITFIVILLFLGVPQYRPTIIGFMFLYFLSVKAKEAYQEWKRQSRASKMPDLYFLGMKTKQAYQRRRQRSQALRVSIKQVHQRRKQKVSVNPLTMVNIENHKLSHVSVRDYENLPELRAPAGYVYIIQDVEVSKTYKIGRTNHPKRRLNKFGVKLPFKTEVVHLIQTDNASRIERYLHQRFAPNRKGGEWFDLSDEQLNAIRHLGLSEEDGAIADDTIANPINRQTESHFLQETTHSNHL